MRACQEEAMQDACLISRWSGTPDSLGEMVGSWTPDERPTRCGLAWSERVEIRDGVKTLVQGEFRLRLPHGTALDPRDRITITARFGEPVEPETYEIDGTPAVGPSGLVVRLQKVTT